MREMLSDFTSSMSTLKRLLLFWFVIIESVVILLLLTVAVAGVVGLTTIMPVTFITVFMFSTAQPWEK